jgi:DNA-binding NtrC family response regulator
VLEKQAKSRVAFQQLIGKSPAMQEMFRRLRLAAHSDVTVPLTGESGTKKELAARAIHATRVVEKTNPFSPSTTQPFPKPCLKANL